MTTVDDIIANRAASIRDWSSLWLDNCDTDEARAKFLARVDVVITALPAFGEGASKSASMSQIAYWRDHAKLPAKALYMMVDGWLRKHARNKKKALLKQKGGR